MYANADIERAVTVAQRAASLSLAEQEVSLGLEILRLEGIDDYLAAVRLLAGAEGIDDYELFGHQLQELASGLRKRAHRYIDDMKTILREALCESGTPKPISGSLASGSGGVAVNAVAAELLVVLGVSGAIAAGIAGLAAAILIGIGLDRFCSGEYPE
ncbi:MAG: hypothetical protein ABIE42_06695 [Candidatus Eisenbacteria bacterium]